MLLKVFVCLIVNCIIATVIRGANILLFMPLPFKSHIRGFQPLFKELSLRGHNVTVVSSFLSNVNIANYTEIGPFIAKEEERNVMDMVKLNFMSSVLSVWDLSTKLSKVMSHKNMKRFIHSNSYSFDLVIIESCCQEYTVAIGHKFNAPVINLAPAMVWSTISKWLNVPSTFAYLPNIILGSTTDMTFLDRVKNTIAGAMQLYLEDYLYLPKMKDIMNTHFTYDGWESRPPLEQMLSNVSLTLVNADYAIGIPRPYPPGVIDVGGMHIKEPKPLPQSIQTFLDSADNGVIYFSFGSVVNLNHLPKEKLKIVLKVMGKLEQKVILKWIPDGSVKYSKNIKTGSWFPQSDILAHPNVRLFITHGGLHSLEETIYHAKPIIAVPFFGDQYFNMKLVEEKGYGKMVKFFEMTEESFENAIKEVLSNPTFKEKAEIQSQVFRDQPLKPIDRAIYWIDYVIRNGGAEHLRNDFIMSNDIHYFLIDVLLFLLVPFGFIIWLCYLLILKIIS